MITLDLKGKTAVVTGASQGLGAETAQVLHRAGANVVINYHQSGTEAGATAAIQPGGSVRDPEVIAAANERGVAMVFTGSRHFRH